MSFLIYLLFLFAQIGAMWGSDPPDGAVGEKAKYLWQLEDLEELNCLIIKQFDEMGFLLGHQS